MISVVLPFRNAESTLRSCLASISAQNFGHYEVLAIDDHSTDGSTTIVKRFPNHRIRLLQNPGRGLVDALNYGLQASRFKLVARMDADDLMPTDRLSSQFDFMQENPTLVLSGGQAALYPVDIIRPGYAHYIAWQNSVLSASDVDNNMFVESVFAHPSVCFQRDIILSIGGYRDGEFPEDYDLWLRLHNMGYAMAKLNKTVVWWRESEGRLSRNDPRYARSAFDALRAQYLYEDPRLHQERPLAIWGAGRRTRQRVAWLLKKGLQPTAWIDIDPKKIGNQLQQVPVVGPDWLSNSHSQAIKPFVLVYVTNHGARESSFGYLQRAGYCLGKDYLGVG